VNLNCSYFVKKGKEKTIERNNAEDEVA